MAADFETARVQLLQARAASEAARIAAQGAAEQSRSVARANAPGTNTPGANVPGADAAAAKAAASNAAATNAATANENARRAAATSAQALAAFAAFTDPRRNAERLSDGAPFALFPVRIETRFAWVPNAGGDGAQAQLWVRIYPDDCSIDTFEPDLSTVELANAKRYWQAIWRAGGTEADERAAWRSLVAAHGSGRAGYIVDSYVPANLASKPLKASPSDEVLVIPTQAALAAGESAAVGAYWQTVWVADGNAPAANAALAALESAVGSAARATQLIAQYVPYNLNDAPLAPAKKGAVAVSTTFVLFGPDPVPKADTWSQAPRVNTLADRFVVLGFNGGETVLEAIGSVVTLPLIVGPDPSVDPKVNPNGAIHPDGENLFVPDELKWLVDFDAAVAAGMALRIDLTPEQARTGFERLLVLGLQLSANAADGKAALTALLQHHERGRSGLTLVPQGTPTHNTTGAGTGYTRLEDADASFDDRKAAPLFTPTLDPNRKRDGQWVAEALGVDPTVFTGVHAAGGADQIQTRAMQRTLWPATFGYWMDKLLVPMFDDDAVENTRRFFTAYVSGRGHVPTLRIGGQPYGILPTTAFSRIAWLDQRQGIAAPGAPATPYLARLLAVLRAIGTEWSALRLQASFVGKAGDAHQILLDILGLHPASAEYHARYAETVDELYNIVNLFGLGPEFWKALLLQALDAPAVDLLQRAGYPGKAPDILKQFFLKDARPVANVIDNVPLSEAAPVRAYTDDGRNYITWLIDAARTSLDALNDEAGFSGGKTPESLLYLYLRHALMCGYYDAGYSLHRSAGFLSAVELQAFKPEATFVHVDPAAAASESRFAALLKTEPRITSQPALLVSDYITANLALLTETRNLQDQIDALGELAGASTAALERAFAEHIDLCSYRYDAWLLGLVNLQLDAMRGPADANGGQETRDGVYLGAYAWVENLVPEAVQPRPAAVPRDLAETFAGPAPLVADPSNGGYIHAPSLAHARTAAVLRSGYLANATQQNPETASVNLSSDRVRTALSLLEGIRNGQSLGALLGYNFERGLHDDHGLAEVDKFIFPLRKAFPLVADAIATTATDSGVPIEAIEARNVLDGLKLVEQTRSGGIAYPFGLGAALPVASGAEGDAINAEVNALLDAYGAIADLALAEGVHQAVQGNFERIAATLDAYTTGNFPPEPEVVQTPPRGNALTHRVAVHFEPGLAAPAGATPRATAEPALDAWLASLLPPLHTIACTVNWSDPVTAAARTRTVSLADLALRPLDLLGLVKFDDVQSMNELDDRILALTLATDNPRPDAVLQISYLTAPAGAISMFEAAALFRSLKALVERSRPLRATDALLHNGASPAGDANASVDRARVAGPLGVLGTLHDDVTAFTAMLGPLVAKPDLNRATLVAGIDGYLATAVALLERAARFGLPQAGWGFAYAWRRAAFADLMTRVGEIVTRWNGKLADFDTKMAAYNALAAGTSNDVRFMALRAAEVVIATALDPLPPLPATLRATLGIRRGIFAARLAQFVAVQKMAATSFASALATAGAIATSDLDAQGVELATLGDRAVAAATDLVTQMTEHAGVLATRRDAATKSLAAHDAAAAPSAQLTALLAAAGALFGSDFRLYPEFVPSPAQSADWSSSLTDSLSGSLTQYLTGTVKADFPVDEWLYGAARVRPNLRTWEQLVLVGGALGVSEPVLVPAQFPYEPGAPWLALEYPAATYVLDSDRLLYTAQYVKPFVAGAPQCGLLVDEWTEVIPADDRDTGITFNFNRPNNEAPQSILLVTPATASGTWQWADLVGALNETLDLAKVRAVEPAQLDATQFARFLPATVLAVSLFGITISTTLAAANGVFRKIRVADRV